ncbi:hypothetical protein KQI86_07800 [Clostridium sp. MSJ-11]|uniref:Uncharacterized protein n=1 Tax=Clostridium mobile TaxID=2841512 RepID=A0ABS6EG85_9CLOT|nr:hypothetical protein [Clostridium mobile]MBU5484231.1 hypothetical protein [Clostridium mobile]
MLDLSKSKIVKRGICLYDNIKEYEVIIIESNIRYGSGDYDDPPEIAEDVECLCYYTWFDSPIQRGEFCTGGGAFMSIGEAMNDVEKESYFAYWTA